MSYCWKWKQKEKQKWHCATTDCISDFVLRVDLPKTLPDEISTAKLTWKLLKTAQTERDENSASVFCGEGSIRSNVSCVSALPCHTLVLALSILFDTKRRWILFHNAVHKTFFCSTSGLGYDQKYCSAGVIVRQAVHQPLFVFVLYFILRFTHRNFTLLFWTSACVQNWSICRAHFATRLILVCEKTRNGARLRTGNTYIGKTNSGYHTLVCLVFCLQRQSASRVFCCTKFSRSFFRDTLKTELTPSKTQLSC